MANVTHIAGRDRANPARRYRIGLLAATAIATLATPGLAQQTAQSSEQAAEQVGDIVVTAQFREQSLQNTPLAITAVTGEQLAEKGIVNMQDLSKVAPSVSLHHTGSAGGKTLAAFIRGVGASDYNFNVEPGVAFYIDDVYLGPSYGTLLEFIDLERVEVLRGPQGTLSGKNAIGGAIRLVSAKPKGDNSGYVEIETGSRRLLRMRGAFDIGLSETLAARLSGYSASQKGLVRLLDFGCVNPTLVGDTSAPYSIKDTAPPQNCQRGTLGNTDVRAARLQFRWTPTPELEVNLSGAIVDDNADGAADVLLAVDPAGFASYVKPGETAPFFLSKYGVPYDERFLPPDNRSSYATFKDPVYGLNLPSDNSLLTKDLTLNIGWTPTDNLSVTSITAYRDLVGSWSYDSDSSPLQTDGVYNTQKHRQFSQELRLSGMNFDNRFNWTVGGFYYDAKQGDIGTIEAAIFNLYIGVNSVPKYENYAGFAHGEFDIVDNVKLIGGIRQSHESKVYRFIEFDLPGTPSNVFPGGLDVPARTEYNRFDWRVGLQVQAAPDHMVYANVATGFRGGGFNPRPSNLQSVVPFGPESQISYELGQRSMFFDRRVRWNNTVYYGDYKDIQLSGRITSITPGGSFPVTVLTNAAKARIWGLESELQAEISDRFSINAAGSYTNFKYLDLGVASELAATSGPTLQSMQRYTPKWKLNAGFLATLPVLEDLGSLTLAGDYSYQTKQYPDARNLPELLIPAYGVLNARLTFKTIDNGWQISLTGTNILDKSYFYNKNYISGNFQLKGNPAPGAEWALSLRKMF
ncbi:MAG TPA: TonB-dependent receptor [Sphingobium sp.]|nr:TonB-dependent receptor [Sphingobium sp.]